MSGTTGAVKSEIHADVFGYVDAYGYSAVVSTAKPKTQGEG